MRRAPLAGSPSPRPSRRSEGLPHPALSRKRERAITSLLLVAIASPSRLGPARAAAAQADITAATRKIDGLLDAWRFGEADGGARRRCARPRPARRRSATSRGTASSCAATTTPPRQALAAAAQTRQRQPRREDARGAGEGGARRRSRITRRSAPQHIVIRYPAEDAVLVPYALDTLEAAYKALHDDLGFDAELPDPRRVLSQPGRPGGGVVAVAGGGGAHGDDRAVQVGAPDGDDAARARLRLPVARQHQPRAGPLRRLDADPRPRAGLAAGRAGQVPRAALARARGRPHPARDGAPARQGAALRQADQLRRHAPVDGEAAVRRGRHAGLRRGGQRDRLPSRRRAGWRRCATRSSA